MGSSMMGGSSSSSASGYSALPKELKKAFDPFGLAINQYALPSNPGVKEMFTPMGQTEAETAALADMNQGFAPNEDRLRSDITMQMNPFDDFVINGINRAADDEYSIFKQGMSEAGQMGSNRSLLGANDIENTRLNNIGMFRQNQFNNAMGNAFTVMPGLRQQDARNQLAGGMFQRDLDTQTRQAPITALQTGTQLMSPFLTGSKTQQTTSPGIIPTYLSYMAATNGPAK